MASVNLVKTGKIEELIAYALLQANVSDISLVSPDVLLSTICKHICLDATDLDGLIAFNPPVMRSIKGHSFETLFKEIVVQSGFECLEVGGDTAIDLKINNLSLQLKTPTAAGTTNEIVQFKTHKTHGAKSELESLEYYHHIDEFSDFLVGLISYDPFQIIILAKHELPRHSSDKSYIKSPFEVTFKGHIGLNKFDLIGIPALTCNPKDFVTPSGLMPASEKALGLNARVILKTIFKSENFRIWDMLMRGFAREIACKKFLYVNKIANFNPSIVKRTRADKADFALKTVSGSYSCFQVKGASVSACDLDSTKKVIAVETQLTRGRVNDHPTQSRLYLVTDFDFLLLGLDPCVARTCKSSTSENLNWEFYAIPSEHVGKHHLYPNRYKSMQKWTYDELQKFLITPVWLNQWAIAS